MPKEIERINHAHFVDMTTEQKIGYLAQTVNELIDAINNLRKKNGGEFPPHSMQSAGLMGSMGTYINYPVHPNGPVGAKIVGD